MLFCQISHMPEQYMITFQMNQGKKKFFCRLLYISFQITEYVVSVESHIYNEVLFLLVEEVLMILCSLCRSCFTMHVK
jgi:hypothetical protein